MRDDPFTLMLIDAHRSSLIIPLSRRRIEVNTELSPASIGISETPNARKIFSQRIQRALVGLCSFLSSGRHVRARETAALLSSNRREGTEVELNCERYSMPRPISHALNNVMCSLVQCERARARVDIARGRKKIESVQRARCTD